MICCRNDNIDVCRTIGTTIGIIIGIVTGYLFAIGIIPITINLIKIAFAMSVIGLIILVEVLLFMNSIKCICKSSRLLLIGSVGTLITTTLTAILGVTTVSLLVSVLVGLSAFFLIILLISIICMLSCIISEICKRDCE